VLVFPEPPLGTLGVLAEIKDSPHSTRSAATRRDLEKSDPVPVIDILADHGAASASARSTHTFSVDRNLPRALRPGWSLGTLVPRKLCGRGLASTKLEP